MPWLIRVRADSGRCWSMCTAVHGSAVDMAAQSLSHSLTSVLLPWAMGSESQRANPQFHVAKEGQEEDFFYPCLRLYAHHPPLKLPSAE